MQNNAIISEDVRAEKERIESKGYQRSEDLKTKVNKSRHWNT
jgi:hypothetical protein